MEAPDVGEQRAGNERPSAFRSQWIAAEVQKTKAGKALATGQGHGSLGGDPLVAELQFVQVGDPWVGQQATEAPVAEPVPERLGETFGRPDELQACEGAQCLDV